MKSKVTKKQIKVALKSNNATLIFKTAKMCGINVTERSNVLRFIREYAYTKKQINNAFNIAYSPKLKEPTFKLGFYEDLRHEVIKQLKNKNTPYFKILILGNNNIYWASSAYGHSDYNKSICMENTLENRMLAEKINRILLK